MGQLFFKKRLQELIRSGAKRTTVRRWARPRVKAGGRAWSPGLGFLTIEAVEAIELEKLTDADAQADGLANVADLRELLAALYPETNEDGKAWFRVFFRMEGELEPPPPGSATPGSAAITPAADRPGDHTSGRGRNHTSSRGVSRLASNNAI